MDVFNLRQTVIHDYAEYVRSFVQIRNPDIKSFVDKGLSDQALWPQPLIQMNPSFASGGAIDDLVNIGALHEGCRQIFRIKSADDLSGKPMLLHRHQYDAIQCASRKENYVLTTGTGSGKSLSYIVPIVDHVLRSGSRRGIQAIVVYPMNALCNSQYGELEKFLKLGFADGKEPVRFGKYTGQESMEVRDEMCHNPPDILLTNYVMLELLLTRPYERNLITGAKNLAFLVLDELHTYRGRQGSDVAMLVRRVREASRSNKLLCVGTSATMASGGTFQQQQSTIAGVASKLFGSQVKPANIIGETLTRATPELDFADPFNKNQLNSDISRTEIPNKYETFTATVMASWLESTFGVRFDAASQRLVRAVPRNIEGDGGVARELQALTESNEGDCKAAIERWLLAGYACEANPSTKQKPFAFRLHQFISRGDTVYASLEDFPNKHLSMSGQLFVPGSEKSQILLPLCFCRECGAEYYSVWKMLNQSGQAYLTPRDMTFQGEEPEDGEAGFLYRDPASPFPDINDPELISRVPDDWLEDHRGQQKLRSSYKEYLPKSVPINPDGNVAADGVRYEFIPAPFRFCLNCGVTYRVRKGSRDFAQLATLASGGRSTATTILSISNVRFLQKEESIQDIAKKLLSFTDNRQDASLQAGHFNDFVEVSLIRSGLYKAIENAGPEGIYHDELTQKVFKSLALPIELYAREPGVQFAQRQDTERAFRNVLGYRIYRDQRRGWRLTSPNLEQCGLLKIEYPSLDQLAAEESFWNGTHLALTSASPQTRFSIAKVLLDYMRRELAINVDFLTTEFFERVQQQSSQSLREPWAIDENERMESASVIFPRSRSPHDRMFYSYLSGRSGFGMFLSRLSTFPDLDRTANALKLTDKETIIQDLFKVLSRAGFVSEVIPASDGSPIPGYQIAASSMKWTVSDGAVAFHDPIRVPNPPKDGSRTNKFFVDFYKTVANDLRGLEAREHTAQVPYELREQREKDFGNARLKVLYCSPTMELGVDIRQLNVVNMRNVPPTPANYAQRSGRAGRGGQPALVLTYCTSGSSHDQYFFRQPKRMVVGSVSPPQLDLANEDLIRAHVQAIWLAESNESLGNSLTDILDVEGVKPTLELLPSKKAGLSKADARTRALTVANAVLDTIRSELTKEKAPWFTDNWLEIVINQTLLTFEQACGRWKDLFWAAKKQAEYHNAIINDVARRAQHDESKRLRREAESQIELLTDSRNVAQSDFYSYRYFASEGFLPGYNFPRLPLSAFIGARRRGRGQDEYLSRPRFLAISEFGPRSIIYHEGSRYIVNRVILPVGDGDNAVTTSARICVDCGYMHEGQSATQGPDLCENCNGARLSPIGSMLRLQNVATKRRDRISSDEEERLRLGYELATGLRYKEVGGRKICQVAQVQVDGGTQFNLCYGDAATIWRINLGWRRRANKEQRGFILDVERGYWQSRNQLEEDDDPDDPMSPRTQRVVPFVEDRRNCMVIEPCIDLSEKQLASFQAIVKKSIQGLYQLEDNELASEPLPSNENRKRILLYESAEGGAGVLRRLLENDKSFADLATEALRLCHYDPNDGTDLKRAEGAAEDCEAACYDCLLSYSNQREHSLLARDSIRDMLLELKRSVVQSSPTEDSFAVHLDKLKATCDTKLEKDWLDFLVANGLNLPTSAQRYFEPAQTRPDFQFEHHKVMVYVDGPVHDFPDRQKRDEEKRTLLDDMDYTVLRFHHQEDWLKITAKFPHVFGTAKSIAKATEIITPANSAGEALDLDLFSDEWRGILGTLAQRADLAIEPGADVQKDSRVIGAYVASIERNGKTIYVVDASDPSHEDVSTQLQSETLSALAIDPADSDAVKRILAALEVT